MDHAVFRAWFAEIDDLTTQQRQEVASALAGQSSLKAVTAAIEDRLGGERVCPHCGCTRSVGRGRADGLQRYRCKDCGKTFNALTGTPLARLRQKEHWLDFGRALSEGDTVAESAERCDVAVSTAFRWRHRFLKAADTAAKTLKGIVEADETYLLSSRKGERGLDRKARKRGGTASKRGTSKEFTPAIVAVDRSGATFSAILPAVTAKAAEQALGPVLDPDALLVTDGSSIDPACAAALGITHEALNHSKGERVRGDLHINTVNSRHEALKTFLQVRRGIATRYFDSYLRWFHLVVPNRRPTPRACLNAALGMQFRVSMPS